MQENKCRVLICFIYVSSETLCISAFYDRYECYIYLLGFMC